MLKKLLTTVGLTGGQGLIGLISEKTGKISFKRSAAVVVLTAIMPRIASGNASWIDAVIVVGALAAVALPEILKKDENNNK